MSRLIAIPMPRDEAVSFVDQHHRHRHKMGRIAGHLFAIGCALDGHVIGVAIVGRPSARALQDGWTAEVRRLCTDGTKNACSFLYAACWRATRAMGYLRLVTYTLAEESGASLRGAGWAVVAAVKREHGWSRENRPRVDVAPHQAKLRWEIIHQKENHAHADGSSEEEQEKRQGDPRRLPQGDAAPR